MTESSSSFDSRFSFFFFIFVHFLLSPVVPLSSSIVRLFEQFLYLSVCSRFILPLFSSFTFPSLLRRFLFADTILVFVPAFSLSSSFYSLFILPLALSLFLTSEQNRCFEPWTFFSSALLAQLYMPLILFKLQSFPLSFFSISLYTISLTESTPFSFSITSRLGSRFAYISPICSPKFPNSWCPTVQTIRVARQRGPSLFLSHSFTHSLIITRIYRPERESLPFAQIFVLSIFVSPPPPLLIPLSLPPRVRAFCIAAGALSASLGCSKVNLY